VAASTLSSKRRRASAPAAKVVPIVPAATKAAVRKAVAKSVPKPPAAKGAVLEGRSDEMDAVRLGFVGYGIMGERLLRATLAQDPGVIAEAAAQYELLAARAGV